MTNCYIHIHIYIHITFTLHSHYIHIHIRTHVYIRLTLRCYRREPQLYIPHAAANEIDCAVGGFGDISIDGDRFYDTVDFASRDDNDIDIGDVFYDVVADDSVLEYPQKSWLDPLVLRWIWTARVQHAILCSTKRTMCSSSR